MSITPDAIRQWVRDTLEEAEYYKIPGTIAHPDRKDTLKRYRIDRESLSAQNISEYSINRLYRCLFIYSIGFNEMLQTLLNQTANKLNIIKSVWKVFCILLEH